MPDGRYIPVSVHYSLCALPENPMTPRWADNRVGYFLEAVKVFGRDDKESFWLRYVDRWRLEKKDPSAAVSEVVKPITYYIDWTVPEKFRPWVKEGVEKWQKAYEAAGLKNAIVAIDPPKDDPEWDAEDARYSTLRLITSSQPSFGAIGPSRVDPRTGEIFDADIRKISGIMPCTVIRPEDMADRILNRDKHPQWQGQRTKMVYAFPPNEKLWQQYAQIRAESLRQEKGLTEATEFYEQNRELMDEGSIVAWPERYNQDEASAIQHAMNLRLQNEAAFFAEYQNEPLPEVAAEDDLLTADQITAKTNGQERGRIPLGCGHVTMFVDVQQKLLYWVVCAWEDDFTGYVIDYGSYPDQRRAYFTLRDATRTLATAAKGTGLEGSIYSGLESLTADLLSRRWRREDGTELRIDRCLIDANWGSSTDVVYQFCRQSPHAGIVLPSHGRFVGAASRPFSEYKRKPGERVGLNWRVTNNLGKRTIRHVLFDTNFWKSFVQARLVVSQGDPGCLSLFEELPASHRLFAEHLTSEYRIRTEGRGRTVDEWKIRPEQADNHWFDGVVGCAVAAAIQGCVLFGTDDGRTQMRPSRVKLSDLKRGRRA